MSSASGPDSSEAAVRLVLVGATGRMGRQILRLLPDMPGLRLVGAVASEHSAQLGMDAGVQAGMGPYGVPISAEIEALLAQSDVVVDFSLASAVERTLSVCTHAGVSLLIGATGLPAALSGPLDEAARRIALLVAPNTSVGVNLLLELVQQAARVLRSYDVEIVDVHHRHKLDAPSGTALALGQAAAQGRGQALAEVACYARQGQVAQRASGQIGFAAIRGGDVVGEHEVRLLGQGESLMLAHRVTDRAVFARGALLAARWLSGRQPGRYTMRDVLSLESASWS